MNVNVSERDRLSSRDVICQTIIQPDGTNWSRQAALYRSAGGSKHSQPEHTAHRRPCCIGLQADQNTAGWSTLPTEGRAVSVCRRIKTQPAGAHWPQKAVLYRCAGKSKHSQRANSDHNCRLEPNGRNKPRSVGLQGNKKQPVRTNLTARMKLLIAFSSFPLLHHR
jgi:hypothetical protein